MTRAKTGIAGRLALGAGAFLLAAGLPSAVAAVGQLSDSDSFSPQGRLASFTPASVDPRLAEILGQNGGKARMMRFTPAGASADGASRSITVAVRIDSEVVQAISGRNQVAAARDTAPGGSSLRIASTRYNLGLARGYSSFVQAPAPALSGSLSAAQIPDLATFRPSPGVREEPSRFAARIELEQGREAARSTEVDGLNSQLLDVGGSYRLTRNLDVTAGVRYEQDRDLRPLPDMEKQDSQAVYVGTQFRF